MAMVDVESVTLFKIMLHAWRLLTYPDALQYLNWRVARPEV